jgi:hypothetical protein
MDHTPIEMHVVPNVDEHTRVSLRRAYTSPIGVIVSAVILMITLFLLFFATAIMTGSHPDYLFGPMFVVIALMLPIGSYLRTRFLIRSRFKASIEKAGPIEAVFSEDTIEFREAHRSVRREWNNVKWARRIPEGVLMHIGSKQVFYSRTYFADGDFDRFMDLLRDKLGARAKV